MAANCVIRLGKWRLLPELFKPVQNHIDFPCSFGTGPFVCRSGRLDHQESLSVGTDVPRGARSVVVEADIHTPKKNFGGSNDAEAWAGLDGNRHDGVPVAVEQLAAAVQVAYRVDAAIEIREHQDLEQERQVDPELAPA